MSNCYNFYSGTFYFKLRFYFYLNCTIFFEPYMVLMRVKNPEAIIKNMIKVIEQILMYNPVN